MRRKYKIIGKMDNPMPDLIVDRNGISVRVDPYVSNVIDLSEYEDDLKRINEYIDTLIGSYAYIDFRKCGYAYNAFIPYTTSDFKLCDKKSKSNE